MLQVYWLEQTEADLPADNDWLSASEVLHLCGLRFAKRRADWRLGRWTAKRALAVYLRVPRQHHRALTGIEIRPAPSGAPEAYFANSPAAVTISLSHRADTAVCAVAPSGADVGCDLEVIERRSDGFIADYFTEEEQALVAQAAPAERFQLLALLWSAKESALKALRTGLRLDTRSVIVSLDGGESNGNWRSLNVRYTGGQIFQGWWQQTGKLLRTMVAAPPPVPPIAL